MSDTPKTDAEEFTQGRYPVVYADFARTLERELAEAEASIAHLRHCARLQDNAMAAVLERAERAEIELAALREDAERYRWLRDNIMTLPYDDWGMGPQFPSGNELGAAIDAAKGGE